MRAAYPFANNPYLQETVENLQPAMSRAYFLALDQRKASMSEFWNCSNACWPPCSPVTCRRFACADGLRPAQLRSGGLRPDGRLSVRLKCIKLAGFKSFVDPTTVNFPSNMAAVVGPNGCGKSNIIDAVRWVMGESSAKNLRGESMTDVIFNGSTSRKPVSQASIELVFDNSDGTWSANTRPTPRFPFAAKSPATARTAISSTAPSAAVATSPTSSSAPAWARAATRSSSRG
jgi:hypothetical protein